MSTPDKPRRRRGRPPLEKGAGASTQIQLRAHPDRKAAYEKAAKAQRKTLAAWAFGILDASAGYTPPDSRKA